MTYCAHGIPDETGCDECEESVLITWAEELQREPYAEPDNRWLKRALAAAFVLPMAWAVYNFWGVM